MISIIWLYSAERIISVHQRDPELPQINLRSPMHSNMPPEPPKNQYTAVSTHLGSTPPPPLPIYQAIMAPLLTHSCNSAWQGTAASMLFDTPVDRRWATCTVYAISTVPTLPASSPRAHHLLQVSFVHGNWILTFMDGQTENRARWGDVVVWVLVR
jgi:hypothetical protein